MIQLHGSDRWKVGFFDYYFFCEDWFLKSLKILCRSFSLHGFHFTPLDIFGCQFSQPSRDVCSKIPSAGSEDTSLGIFNHLANTPRKINMEPKNGALEDDFPFSWVISEVPAVHVQG